MDALPTIFISHGSPDTAIADTAAATFLKGFAATIARPRAIIVVSAHFEVEGGVAVTADAMPETIHDFGGFDRKLYEIRYGAPGLPGLAADIARRLTEQGFKARTIGDRGFDHGTWVPLSLIYPEADIPVVQVSVDPGRDAAYHMSLGRALADLRGEDVLIIGSGSFTHNLGEAFKALRAGRRDAPVPDWVAEFAAWMDDRIRAGDEQALTGWLEQAPHAARNHPTPEHLMPLFVAIGAANRNAGWRADAIHASNEFGALAMDAYAFH
ncbi:DODA-type extradiol aromatic ring-opening family dioxygenase [Pararhizobium haloflavum]|uniref:DODA-type extradiol aromatic ring-opening family dioxygenase n=1 Tax=Pararhizobium haloflavum TaxID=2037914 RepID=UPI000C18C6B8|nr:class III extradiol ring-cleavage dioxygenase [Pararhizobium haloflavum]